MHRLTHTLALAGLLATQSAAARADLFSIEWNAQGRDARELRLVPGGFVELCGPLQDGQTIAWRFEANAPTDFNVHYHEGEKVVTPVAQRGARKAQGRLAVKSSQEYCWMWTHRGKGTQAATLRVELRRLAAAR